jgi:hypothetical protein
MARSPALPDAEGPVALSWTYVIDRALRRFRQRIFKARHVQFIRRCVARTPDPASRWHMTPEDVALMARRSATVHGRCCDHPAHREPRYQRHQRRTWTTDES